MSEDEIKVGDLVVPVHELARGEGEPRTVVCVHTFDYGGSPRTKLWLEKDGKDHGSHQAEFWKKVRPRFEVGKTYRNISGSPGRPIGSRPLATVVSVSANRALGWYADGSMFNGAHHNFPMWEEVGVTVNAEAHKNLRALGIEL